MPGQPWTTNLSTNYLPHFFWSTISLEEGKMIFIREQKVFRAHINEKNPLDISFSTTRSPERCTCNNNLDLRIKHKGSSYMYNGRTKYINVGGAQSTIETQLHCLIRNITKRALCIGHIYSHAWFAMFSIFFKFWAVNYETRNKLCQWTVLSKTFCIIHRRFLSTDWGSSPLTTQEKSKTNTKHTKSITP